MIKGQYTITTIKIMNVDPYGGGHHETAISSAIMAVLRGAGFKLFNFSLPIPKKWMGEPDMLFTLSTTLHRAPRCKKGKCNLQGYPCSKCGNCTCYNCVRGGSFPTCEA